MERTVPRGRQKPFRDGCAGKGPRCRCRWARASLGRGCTSVSQEARSVQRLRMPRAFVVSALGSKGLRQFGGPAEKTGRLRYVDGCSDTLLLSPPRKGEPCLNHLHIPKGVKQRQHYHPSDRVGIILAGSGVCCADEGDFALTPGSCWLIPAGSNHHFETHAETLDVITWHPDSDFGPSDEDHPMINRTWVR